MNYWMTCDGFDNTITDGIETEEQAIAIGRRQAEKREETVYVCENGVENLTWYSCDPDGTVEAFDRKDA